MIPNSYVPNKSSNFGLCTGRHLTVLSYRMHGVQDLGELVKSPRAGGRVLPLASDDPVKFLNVIHSKFIKELLVLQAIHWNWMEQGERLCAAPCQKTCVWLTGSSHPKAVES